MALFNIGEHKREQSALTQAFVSVTLKFYLAMNLR